MTSEHKNRTILVPIALFSSLSRRGLCTRIEGLWGHRIFEFNSIFLIGCLKTKKSWAEVKMFARIASAKAKKQLWPAAFTNANSEEFEGKFSQFFIFTAQHFSWLDTCRCCNKSVFCWLTFSTRKAANNLECWVFTVKPDVLLIGTLQTSASILTFWLTVWVEQVAIHAIKLLSHLRRC